MGEPVKPRRAYRSSARERQRDATRVAIVDAATAAFVTEGYAATTISRIAESADVSPETVYAVFGSKRDVLRAVVERAAAGVVGGDVVRDEWLAHVRAEPDQRRRLALMSDATRDVLRRVAPIDELVRSVAASDPEIAELQDELERRRLAEVRVLVGLLADAGPLRVPIDEAADLMWSLSRSTDLYRSLTGERGWSDRRARAAFADVLARVLLPDA